MDQVIKSLDMMFIFSSNKNYVIKSVFIGNHSYSIWYASRIICKKR